jgi:ABC-type branched-subunit amino acid transport system substrate-binding protein
VLSFCSNSWAWAYAGCQVTTKFNTTTGPEMVAQASGIKIPDQKVAIEGIALQAAVAANQAGAATFAKLGATVVYNKNEIPFGGQNTDYTPFVQGIIASKANVVYEVTDLASSIGLTAALKAAGFKGVLFNGEAYLPDQIATQSNISAALDGSYVVVQAPAQEDQSPAIQQEQTDLKAVGASPTIAFGTDIGYWTADMFVQMLEATGAKGPITQQTLHDVAAAGVTLPAQLKGGNGPLIFPKYQTEPLPCASFVQAQGNKYVSKVPYTCYQDISLP